MHSSQPKTSVTVSFEFFQKAINTTVSTKTLPSHSVPLKVFFLFPFKFVFDIILMG